MLLSKNLGEGGGGVGVLSWPEGGRLPSARKISQSIVAQLFSYSTQAQTPVLEQALLKTQPRPWGLKALGIRLF